MSRIGLVVGFLVAFALGGLALLFGTSGGAVGIGSGERPSHEQEAIRSEGTCVIRRDGTLVGRLLSQAGPSRGNPHLRYVVEEAQQRRVIQVYASEVRLVPCAAVEP